jgi:hypothetical protein
MPDFRGFATIPSPTLCAGDIASGGPSGKRATQFLLPDRVPKILTRNKSRLTHQ